MSLMSALEGLAAAGIKSVVVGGIAARVQGATRVTDDVDVCYSTTTRNERALVALMNEWNAYPRDMRPGHPYKVTVRELRAAGTLRLTTTHGNLDLLRAVKGLGAYDDIVQASDSMTLSNRASMPVANLEQMIRAKRAAGRPKDIQDARELEAAKKIRGLDDIDDTPKPDDDKPRRRSR